MATACGAYSHDSSIAEMTCLATACVSCVLAAGNVLILTMHKDYVHGVVTSRAAATDLLSDHMDYPVFMVTNCVCIMQGDMTPEARRAAYLSDITYVTNSELGFDYLRDNLAAVSQKTAAALQQGNACRECF